MSKSPNDMTHINYKAVKERMTISNKGFWKVQSIQRLTTRLQNHYNPKDYILLKTIQKPPLKLPKFISFQHEKRRKLENHKNNSCINLKVGNFFITGNEKKLINKQKKQEIKIIFDKLFGKYTYEPFLYNDIQFFYLQKEKRLLPRKFNDVVKDCLAFKEYKNCIKNLKKTKDENITTDYNINLSNKNLIYNEKPQSNDLNVLDKSIKQNTIEHLKENNEIKTEILSKHKIYQRKSTSCKNVRENNIRRSIVLKSDVGRNYSTKKFPTFIIN